MEKHLLSKSSFIKGNQCVKALYLYKNYYHLKDPYTAEQQALFSRGTDIGMLARNLFPGGVDVSPQSPFKYRESVIRTAQLIQEGADVIYEAAFQHEQVLAAVDILVKKEGKWMAYEVKSSTKISPTYILDSSLQHWVITNSGIELNDFFIVNINNQYVRKGRIEAEKLFVCTSVIKDAVKNFPFVNEKITQLKTMLAGHQQPEIEIGEHCFVPYQCDFMGTCWKSVPADSVFDLAMTTKEEQFKMYRSGIKKITDLPDDYPLNKNAQVQVKSFKKKETIIEKTAVNNFVNGLSYPLYFMDFETFMPAVPIYDLSKPYQHIPFQYSVHYKESKEGEIKHLEFLAETGADPRRSFIEQLLGHLSDKGDILVYNLTFERSVLNALKNDFPQYASEIDAVTARLKDLMVPFKEKHYYHPDMKGSYSIKNVLPALVSELKYDGLKIGQGSVAMAAFEKLQNETDIFKIAETRDALLEYCKMDTLAMVRILEVLEKC
jgi:hypothetical protein